MRHRSLSLAAAGMAVLAGFFWTETTPAQSAQVADGMKVSLEYTLTLPDKTVVDSNAGRAPISFIQGQHQVVPGLEKALAGMSVGQQKKVDVAPEEGYGAYDKAARATVDKSKIPSGAKVGAVLRSANGQPVTVLEISDKTAVLDLNHPLAGKHLIFDVKVLNVERPEAPPSTGTAR